MSTVMRGTLAGMIGALCLLGTAQAAVTNPKDYLIDEKEELRLAATAGPPAVTEGAAYYSLREDGYHKVNESSNGFHCFVERSFGAPSPSNEIRFDPRIRAPHCINPEGARTRMKEFFLVAKLAMSGYSSEQINRAVDLAYGKGELQNPKGLALTYMMSKHQWLGERASAWKPHVMLWIPYLSEEQVGALLSKRTPNALLVGQPGSRRAGLVFPVPNWVE